MRGRRAVFGVHSTILATAYTPLPSCAPCLVAADPGQTGVPTYANVGIAIDVCYLLFTS